MTVDDNKRVMKSKVCEGKKKHEATKNYQNNPREYAFECRSKDF